MYETIIMHEGNITLTEIPKQGSLYVRVPEHLIERNEVFIAGIYQPYEYLEFMYIPAMNDAKEIK